MIAVVIVFTPFCISNAEMRPPFHSKTPTKSAFQMKKVYNFSYYCRCYAWLLEKLVISL